MNQDRAQGEWTELKGKIKAKWGKLTDDDLEEAKGNLEVVKGKIQKAYGYKKEKAEVTINPVVMNTPVQPFRPPVRPTPAPAPQPKKDCDPPYTIDSATGHRKYKPWCN